MYKTVLPVLLFFLATTAQAQDTTHAKKGFGHMWPEEAPRTHHELGINVSGFIKTFITPANSTPLSASANTYLLTYKCIFKPGAAIRFGWGGNTSNKNHTDDNFAGTLNVKNNQLNTRLGFEWQFKITKRWNFYTGVDAIYSSALARSETALTQTDKVITKTQFTAVGGGPVVGIQFRLNRRISLLAEGALYFQSSKTTDKSVVPGFPENNSSTIDKENSFNFTGPQSIFLVITF